VSRTPSPGFGAIAPIGLSGNPTIKDHVMNSHTVLLYVAKASGRCGGALKAAGIAVLTATLLAAAAPMAARAEAPDPVVARVSGTDIHQSDLDLAEEDVGSNIPAQTPEAKRDYLVNYVADMILVAKAAEAKKLGDSQDFKQRLAFARNKVLMELLLQDEAKSAVTDAAMHKVYDEASQELEVHARHILVETEDEAKAIEAELKKGADFAELAKQKSKDPGAAEGGDLGYFTKAQMVPEFAEVAFKLDKGQISDPVKTQFGWHIIKVEDKRKRQLPEFDKIKDQLETFVQRKAQVDLVNRLRADGKIERLDTGAQASVPDQKK
jgi:peptidyl-prolyl cis-trans isomerase C